MGRTWLVALLLIAGCGETAETAPTDPGNTPSYPGEGPNAGSSESPRPDESTWTIGASRIIEYPSYLGEGTGEYADVSLKLLGVKYRATDPCGDTLPSGKPDPNAMHGDTMVLLTFRAENVGTVKAEFPQTTPYWRSPQGQHVDLGAGCGIDGGIPSLNPGEWALGRELLRVPAAPGDLVIQTVDGNNPHATTVLPLDPPAAE